MGSTSGRRRPGGRVGKVTGWARDTLTLLTPTLLPPAADRGTLVIPPARPGSEGDSLLVHGAATLLGDPIRIAGLDASDRWGTLTTDTTFSRVVRMVRSSPAFGTAATRVVTDRTARRRWDDIWFIGADVLDGTYGVAHFPYLDLVDLSAARGARSGVCGFSFSTEPAPAAVARLARMNPEVTFVARGRKSAERFEAAIGRRCGSGPDLSWAALIAEHERASGSGARRPDVIGINLSRQVGRRIGREQMIESFTRLIRLLDTRGFEVRLIPHDRRAPDSDPELLTDLARSAELPTPAVLEGPAIRAVAAGCAVVVSCRMHLAISSLAFGTPVVALNYADKLEDLERDPMLAPFLRVVDPGAADLVGETVTAVDQLCAAGPMTPADLAAVHEQKRRDLAALRTGLTGR